MRRLQKVEEFAPRSEPYREEVGRREPVDVQSQPPIEARSAILFGRHPIYGLPFDVPIGNNLRGEYLGLPLGRRFDLLRKSIQRELLILVTNLSKRRVAVVPREAETMLWVYGWTTIGDSVMDLAIRDQLACRFRQVDLCICPALAPLYLGDPYFANVFTNVQDIDAMYDVVLLQQLDTHSLRGVLTSRRATWFASMFEHIRGEQFDRLAYSQRRAEQLFSLPAAEASVPHLHLGTRGKGDGNRYRVAVALGARDKRRHCPNWPEVLDALLDSWPSERPAIEFVLLGSDNARADLAKFDPTWLKRHACVEVGLQQLREAARTILGADAFLGVDGGLMHIAAAVGCPGLGIFVAIDPAFRLHRMGCVKALYAPISATSLVPRKVAHAWLRSLRLDQG